METTEFICTGICHNCPSLLECNEIESEYGGPEYDTFVYTEDEDVPEQVIEHNPDCCGNCFDCPFFDEDKQFCCL